MPKHVTPFDNRNQAIVDLHDETTPLAYFNDVRLKRGETFSYQLEEYESVNVLATGTCTFEVDGSRFENVGQRTHLWDGKPDSVYAPVNGKVTMTCVSDEAEIFIAGGQCETRYEPFRVTPAEVDKVQYGSDETKTHRRILHVLGQKQRDRTGRLLVSELFTVGAGGWSGFPPHKHDEDRGSEETAFEEVYHFRFNPDHGFGAQFAYPTPESYGPVYRIKNGSTVLLEGGYHPSVAAPGYEMYYFTILVGKTSHSLVQFFEPEHAYQVRTIPGIMDMVNKFK